MLFYSAEIAGHEQDQSGYIVEILHMGEDWHTECFQRIRGE